MNLIAAACTGIACGMAAAGWGAGTILAAAIGSAVAIGVIEFLERAGDA